MVCFWPKRNGKPLKNHDGKERDNVHNPLKSAFVMVNPFIVYYIYILYYIFHHNPKISVKLAGS